MDKIKNVLFCIWLAQSFPYGSVKPKQIALAFDGALEKFYNNLDEEVKKVFSDYEYIETTDVWHSDLQKDVHTLIFNISKGKKEELWGVFKQ